MKIIKTILFWIVQIIWGLPQFVLGGLLFLILFPFTDHFIYRGIVCTVKKGCFVGLSLGCFVFINESNNETKGFKQLITHEIAHSYQSLVLGVFWLFIIGIPSLCWAGFIQTSLNKRRTKRGLPLLGYHSFFTEKNAEWIANKYFR